MRDWPETLDAAITVCDRDFTIIYMNAKARRTFAGQDATSMLGKSLADCHKPGSMEKMRSILETGKPNVYTVTKTGVRKLIHQGPWMEDGRIAGLVEISIETPADMPHFDRDAERARS